MKTQGKVLIVGMAASSIVFLLSAVKDSRLMGGSWLTWFYAVCSVLCAASALNIYRKEVKKTWSQFFCLD